MMRAVLFTSTGSSVLVDAVDPVCGMAAREREYMDMLVRKPHAAMVPACGMNERYPSAKLAVMGLAGVCTPSTLPSKLRRWRA